MAKFIYKTLLGIGVLSWAAASCHLFLMYAGRMEPTTAYCGVGGLACVYCTFMMLHWFTKE